MSNLERKSVRCAIYTRKSSEEGLEQSFNSLDAQREACTAYVASQRHEGWRVIAVHYDDGGYSGGDMNRPALKRLLEAVAAGEVDTIVVYKVDRLTRSLADFAKIVEALDSKGVSFVSVTQQFNTTTSMGRLTLNILLSFAQFEREVTGERIRDKIAASKRKGMWMGGRVPLGYDVRERKLVVNHGEAKLVNNLYHWYLELGSVSKLKVYLDSHNIKSKKRVSPKGVRSGGGSFFPGALYLVLQNPIYRGEIRHRQQSYLGQHEAIISQELWEKVQSQLRSDNGGRRADVKANCSSMLTGLLQGADGNRFRPSHTTKDGKRYRYYFLPTSEKSTAGQTKAIRVPAQEIEKHVSLKLQSFLGSPNEVLNNLVLPGDQPATIQKLLTAAQAQAEGWSTQSPAVLRSWVRTVISRIVIRDQEVDLETNRTKFRSLLLMMDQSQVSRPQTELQRDETIADDLVRLTVPTRLKRCGSEMRLVLDSETADVQMTTTPLIKALARAHKWKEDVLANQPSYAPEEKRFDVGGEYLRRVLGLAFLAPDIVEAILDGQYSANLTVKKLARRRLPIDWAQQRVQLGFPTRTDR
jgi:site-specific DNA recombinase